MKIAFYIDNNNLGDIDLSCLKQGNPGIGGTEYITLSLAELLAQNGDARNWRLYIHKPQSFPAGLSTREVTEKSDALQTAERENIDILVIKYEPEWNDILHQHRKSSLKVVVWAHNFISRQNLTRLSRLPNVARIVCVGQEQLDRYRDHNAFRKSIAIYNGFHENQLSKECVPAFRERKHEVVYLGNLVPYKGFHILAKAWKSVLSEVPDAKLNVIGSGKLYNRQAELGPYGIAEASYEREFMPALSDANGNLLQSVIFHGILGKEKEAVLKNARVGVPNPSGVSETFCISALEMQTEGLLIATKRYVGYLDTVYRNGILVEDEGQLAKAIVELLLREDNEYPQMREFIRERFSYAKIVPQWQTLFQDVMEGKPVKHLSILKNPDYAGKQWIERNRRFKMLLPGGKYLPSGLFYQSLWNRFSALTHLLKKRLPAK